MCSSEAEAQVPPTNASSDRGPVALLAPANEHCSSKMAPSSRAQAGSSSAAVADGGGFVVPIELLTDLLRQSEEALGRMEQSFRHRALAMDHTLVALSQAVAHRHPALHAAVQEILSARPAPAVPAPRAAQDDENDMDDEMGAYEKHSDGEKNDHIYADGGSAHGSQLGGAAAGGSARGSSGRPTLDHLTVAVSLADAGLLPDEAVANIDLKRKRETSPAGSREGEERESERSERESYDNNDHSIEGRDGSDRERTGADSGSEDDRRKQRRGESDERSDSAGRSSHKSGSDKSGSDESGGSGGSQPSNASGTGSDQSGSNADSNAGSGSASDASRASAVAGSVGSAGAISSGSGNLSSSSALPRSEPSTAGSGSTSGSSP